MSFRLLVAAFAVCLAPLVLQGADEENPFKKAKVGDYATYKLEMKLGGNTISGVMTQTVTAKNDKEATVKATGKISVLGMEQEIPASEQKIDLTKPFDPTKFSGPGGPPPGTDAKIEKLKDGKEKIKVGGKEYETAWTTYKMKAKAMGLEVDSDLKVWTSKDVPMGLAKMEMTANIMGQAVNMTMELTGTGNKKQ